jgi:hypothetical protein
MSDRNIIRVQILSLCLAALALRIGYLLLALHNLGLERLSKWAPDTEIYYTAARHILSSQPQGGYALFRIGPGYALILAGIESVFGSNPLFAILFSLLMGGLAPVAVYLLALELTRSRAVSLVAGIISTISLTSVALSSQILTDQTAFTVLAFSLVCFVRGFRTAGIRSFIVSGILAGFAAYIRPSSQFIPLILLIVPFFLPLQNRFPSRMSMYRRSLLAGAVSLLMVLAWSARNYAADGAFIFGSNGALTLKRCIVAQVSGNGSDSSIVDLRTKWEIEDGDQSADYVAAYRKSVDRAERAFHDHPGRMIGAFFKNVDKNIRAGNLMIGPQVPSLQKLVDIFNRINRHWLSYVSLLLTAAGLILFIVDRNRIAWLLLGMVYLYSTLIVGFSFWQGSRLHYPAEMASSILVAYALWHAYKRVFSARS